MHHGRRRQILAVVLDLGAEQAAEPNQQIGLVVGRGQTRHQHQTAAFGERRGQALGLALGRRHEVARARAADQFDAATEMGAGQGFGQPEIRDHGTAFRSIGTR